MKGIKWLGKIESSTNLPISHCSIISVDLEVDVREPQNIVKQLYCIRALFVKY